MSEKSIEYVPMYVLIPVFVLFISSNMIMFCLNKYNNNNNNSSVCCSNSNTSNNENLPKYSEHDDLRPPPNYSVSVNESQLN
jgi:hypothetical protein